MSDVTKCSFIIIGLALFLCGGKLINNGVNRIKVSLVLLSLPVLTLGVASFLYVLGFWNFR